MSRRLVLMILVALPAFAVPSRVSAQRGSESVVYQYVECTDVGLLASNLTFVVRSHKIDGSALSLAVAKGYDFVGTYPVGHDTQVQAGTNDA